MKIYLIGLSGAGKSTLGKQLASTLLLDFVDLDHEIEAQEQRSVSEIFRQQGEDYFRQVESDLLRLWAVTDKSFVMATGGGAPCFHDGIAVINETGISIFLDVAVGELVKRLEKESDRPLLHGEGADQMQNKLEKLRASRLACYQRAKLTVQNPTLDSLLNKLDLRKGTRP